MPVQRTVDKKWSPRSKHKPAALSFNFMLIFLSGFRSKEVCFHLREVSSEGMQMNWGWKVKKYCFERDVPAHTPLHHSCGVREYIQSGMGPEIRITNISTHLYRCHWCCYQQPKMVLPRGWVTRSRSFTLLFWTLIPLCAIGTLAGARWCWRLLFQAKHVSSPAPWFLLVCPDSLLVPRLQSLLSPECREVLPSQVISLQTLKVGVVPVWAPWWQHLSSYKLWP